MKPFFFFPLDLPLNVPPPRLGTMADLDVALLCPFHSPNCAANPRPAFVPLAVFIG